jgi:hypothetical protein
MSQTPTNNTPATLAEVNKPMADLLAYIRRTRHWIFTIILSLIVDVSLTVFIFHLQTATNQARKNLAVAIHNQNVQRCIQGNTFRVGDLDLWNTLLNFTPVSPQTAQQQANVRQFKAFLATHDAPVDCSKIQ